MVMSREEMGDIAVLKPEPCLPTHSAPNGRGRYQIPILATRALGTI